MFTPRDFWNFESLQELLEASVTPQPTSGGILVLLMSVSVLCLMGDCTLVEVLLSLSVIIILNIGDACLCFDSLSYRCNELLDLDLD